MRKTVLTLALAAAGTVAFAGDGQIRRVQGVAISGEYIIVLNEDHPSMAVAGRQGGLTVSQVGVELATLHRGSLMHTYEHVLSGFSARLSEAAALAIAKDPRVKYVEENGEMRAIAVQTNPPSYGIDRIDQRSLPLDLRFNFNATDGSGVHAYIIDTGIRATHTQFAGRVGNGNDSVGDGQGTNDCNGHGTHVSGTVGGITVGIARAVTLHPVRVLGCDGSGSNAGVVAGMDWVTANHANPAVANMSLGGGASQATDDAVTRMVNSGVVLAVAAGNSNANACNSSPSRAPLAVTVGSTTSTDARSSFSNFGTCVDIFAPGSSIVSSVNSSDTAMATFSGTSMASPHVAGVAAVLRGRNPNASVNEIVSALISNATTGVVGNAGTGSPNRLLFIPPMGGGGGQVIFTDDFETDKGWTTNRAGTDTAATGQWARGNPDTTTSTITTQQGTTPSGVNALVTGTPAGASAGANDVDGGVTSVDSPAIALPAGATLSLSFSFYFAHLNNAGADDFFRVSIVNAAGTVTTVFQELGAATNDAATYANQTVSLSQFAGQTVRIRFAAADNGTGSLIEAGVDNVSVNQQ